LNYSVYFLLNTITADNSLETGSLDYCFGEMAPLLIDEIFGKLKKEKELDIGTRIPEMKKNKAYESFHLICKVLNFENSIIEFIKFIEDSLKENLDSEKNASRFEELFHHVLEGFGKNNSVTANSLILISYSLVKDALEIIENS
jgi:hypothetical protein